MRVRKQRVARSAFTLLEVLIVMAILIVLAGAGALIVMRYLDDSKLDRARLDLKTLSTAVESYKIKYHDYPPSLESLAQRMADGSAAYVEVEALIDPWGQPYVFERENRHPQTGKPHIYSEGPSLGDPNSRISNWTAISVTAGP